MHIFHVQYPPPFHCQLINSAMATVTIWVARSMENQREFLYRLR